MRKFAGLLAALLLLAGCGDAGDAAVRAELTARQDAVIDTLERSWRPGTDPVWLVRSTVVVPTRTETGHDGGPFAVAVEPLGWDDQHLDLRFTVSTEGYRDGNVFGTSYGPGSDRRCVRFSLGFDIGHRDLDCTGLTTVGVPDAPYVAPLEPAPLLKALRSAGYDQAVAAARKAYDQPELVVDAAVVDGSWAIVVTRPDPYDCIAGVRSPGGAVRQAVIPRATRQPGEGGCSPQNAVDPVRTH